MIWLAAAIVVLILSLTFQLGWLVYAMYVLLGVMLVSRLLSRVWSDNVVVGREFNRLTAEVGEKVAVVVNVRNRGVLPVIWTLIEDLLPRRAIQFNPPDLKVEGRRLQLAMLSPRGRCTLYYQLQCNRRGYYQIGPLVIETGDLFGLHRRYRVAADPNFLLVYPPVLPLDGYDVASPRPIGEIRLRDRLYEDPTRIAGVRRYEPGDPLNRVHWRATARTGQLHSKIYEASCVSGATILLDLHESAYDAANEPVRSELAISAVAAIANHVYEMGQQIGLVTNARDAADRIRVEGWDADLRTRDAARRSVEMLEASDRLQPVIVPTRRGPEQLMQILRTLARAELTDGLTLDQLIRETASRMPRDATVIAIVRGLSAENAVALANLRRSGFSVSVVINVHDEHHFADLSEPLLAARIETRHLQSAADLATICRDVALR